MVVVVRGMAAYAVGRGMSVSLGAQALMTGSTVGSNCGSFGVGKAKDFGGIAIAINVSLPGSMTGFTARLFGFSVRQ